MYMDKHLSVLIHEVTFVCHLSKQILLFSPKKLLLNCIDLYKILLYKSIQNIRLFMWYEGNYDIYKTKSCLSKFSP